MIPSRMKEQIIEHEGYKYLEMIATEVSLRTGHEKLVSLSLSDKNIKSGILENATENYLDYFKASDKIF